MILLTIITYYSRERNGRRIAVSDRTERAFVAMLNDTAHWKAQRAAASGSGGDADLPDVTFAHDGIAFAAEEKTSSAPYIYVDEAEFEALQRYAAAYGMRAVILGRFKGERAYYLWNPNEMERTDAGTLRGSPDDEQWAAKIAEPDGTAEGIDPERLTSFALTHSLLSKLTKCLTTAPGDGGGPLERERGSDA